MKASVLMITYNHERFIEQAIESALGQRVNFPYEILIADDCSTDGTIAIVRRYAARHPSRIRPLWTERNLGIVPNFLRTWQACRGQYIAVLEGDDYWTSERKLQCQVDAMDEHPEWPMSFQPAQVVFDDGRPSYEYPAKPRKAVFTIRDLLLGNPIQTCAVIYRAGLVGGLPEGLERLSLADWPLAILHALRGEVGLVDEVMSVYRRHPGGSWSPQSTAWRADQVHRMFDLLRPLLRRELERPEPVWAHDAKWTALAMEEGAWRRARHYSRHCVRALPLRPYSWRLFLWAHLGRLGRALDPQRGRLSSGLPS